MRSAPACWSRMCAAGMLGALLLAGCQRDAVPPASSTAPAAGGNATPAPATPPVFPYVPNQRSGTVSVIDTHTDTVVRTLSAQGQLGKRLQQLLPGPHGHLYLIDAEHHRLVELDSEKDAVLRSVDIGENAEGIALSPDGKQFAVCVEGQNQVMLIDVAQFTVQQVIATRGQAPEHCAYTPDGKWLLTSNEGSNDMDMIELATHRSRGVVATSGHPRGMAFAPDGRSVYIAQETANVVDVIDLQTRQRRASLPAGVRTAGVALSADGTRLYASNGGAGTVSVIDLNTARALAEIPVGQRPWNPALTPTGDKLYVANGRSNTVSVIDTASLRELNQIPVGELPWGVIIAR
ncbi:surface antigen [Xanthomonas citri pv. fuscans]|uniref:Surface antigen n=1 Tax=Xanthomonas citri pv. fuscans TaxID=366649 RepID=A0AB34Q7H2_XANCI|nr:MULTISPECIES: beta-propeller fold lactonase family protein [Xanthomonas]ATS64888.1 beta-propeller fold lactonase family protein [Xanthomonas citri pv. phaseoli var. fuscans]ATS66659.1 beta-propeller fold lactonase family protein [Xanthomonas citri pv. phaseoli var. fuscans]ATS73797.1 beta-propeller fold lactonase family protein [Xanthomonas citri pv. phaseoli var. fuscans]ATS76633.1 beta-propeller fold lactonase family protein [Xanthomonas citri pv. phaseoli var. fuscans]ATS79057.1 beta-pro